MFQGASSAPVPGCGHAQCGQCWCYMAWVSFSRLLLFKTIFIHLITFNYNLYQTRIPKTSLVNRRRLRYTKVVVGQSRPNNYLTYYTIHCLTLNTIKHHYSQLKVYTLVTYSVIIWNYNCFTIAAVHKIYLKDRSLDLV